MKKINIKFSNLGLLDKMVVVAAAMFIFSLIFVYAYGQYTADRGMNNSMMSNMSNHSHVNNNIHTKNNYTYANNKSSNIRFSRSNISIKPINLSLATERDMQLMNITKEGTNILRIDLKNLADAAKNENLKNIADSGKDISQDSQKYLNMISNIHISPSFQILLDEYRLELDNFNEAGKYMESGAINYGDLDISKSYLDEAIVHLNNVYILMGINNSSR